MLTLIGSAIFRVWNNLEFDITTNYIEKETSCCTYLYKIKHDYIFKDLSIRVNGRFQMI